MELPTTDRLADPQRDALYSYDGAAQKTSARPWKEDPRYFKSVRISPVALTKMVMHARSGGSLEVMGLMQGYVDGTTLIVTDAFRLPVEGTETRVNAQDEANEYLVEYLQRCRDEAARMENVIGWYHSHPGYGCWLSGIDVSTQSMQQSFNDPFVAVVIDPDRTVSAGKVEIGAFRTLPNAAEGGAGVGLASKGEDYEGSGAGSSAQATDSSGAAIPLAKAEDFGAHASKYYALEVEHFRSTLDSKLLELLWNKYWVQTLAQNPLLTNRDYGTAQMKDLNRRVWEARQVITRGAAIGRVGEVGTVTKGSSPALTMVDRSMDKIVREIDQVAKKERAGLMATEVKVGLFGGEEKKA